MHTTVNTDRDELVRIEREDEIAIVTMNEPARRNPFSLPMRLALRVAFHRLLHDDDTVRAIVLTGAGEHFCAGGDLSEMTEAPPLLELRDRIAIACGLFRLLHAGGKPVVAAIEGVCVGAGLSLACAADIAIGTSSSRYGCAFVKVGLLPDTGLLWTLPQRVGHGHARELMLSGRMFDAQAALDMGVLHQVTEPGTARSKAVERARALSAIPPVTLALLKAALVNGMNTLEDACRLEIDLNPLVRQTADHLEAIGAFMEKRKPVFTGQ
jgi:enoyl-CoA hydratase/carnithine racemase